MGLFARGFGGGGSRFAGIDPDRLKNRFNSRVGLPVLYQIVDQGIQDGFFLLQSRYRRLHVLDVSLLARLEIIIDAEHSQDTHADHEHRVVSGNAVVHQ